MDTLRVKVLKKVQYCSGKNTVAVTRYHMTRLADHSVLGMWH
ncbi:hypothetical protein [Alcanivorax sp.]